MKSNIFVPLAVCMSALFSVSCGDKAKISGRLAGSDTCTVILEETTANGPIDIDTVQTDRKGNFKFSVNLPATGTTFYKIKVNGSLIAVDSANWSQYVCELHDKGKHALTIETAEGFVDILTLNFV